MVPHDLLTPTLGAHDDAVAFQRPWNPRSLVLLTFFFGLPAGGGLLALNFRRFGVRGWTLPSLAGVVLGTVGLVTLSVWLRIRGPSWLSSGGADFLWVGERVLRTAMAAVLAQVQERRFRTFTAGGGRAGALLLSGIAAAVVSLLVELGGRVALYGLFAGRTVL